MSGVDSNWPVLSADVSQAQRLSVERRIAETTDRFIPGSELAEMIERLATRVDELEREREETHSPEGAIGQLQRRLDLVSAELASATAARDRAREETIMLLEYFEFCVAEIQRLDDNLDANVKRAMADFTDELERIKNEQEGAERSLIDLRADQLSAAEAASRHAIETIEMLSETHEVMLVARTTADSSAADVVELAAKVAQVADELRADQQLGQAHLDEVDELISSLSKRIAESESAFASSELRFDEIDAQRSAESEALTQRLDAADLEVTALSESQEQMLESLAEAQRTAADRFADVERVLADVQEALARLGERTDVADEDRAALDNAIIELRLMLEESTNSLDDTRSTLATIEAERAAAEASNEHRFSESDERLASLADEYAAATERVDDAEKMLNTLEAELAKLADRSAASEEIDAQLSTLLSELQVATAETLVLTEETKHRTAELEERRVSDTEAWVEVARDLQSQSQIMQDEVGDLRSEVRADAATARETAEEARLIAEKAIDKAETASDNVDALQADFDEEVEENRKREEAAELARHRLEEVEAMTVRESRRNSSFVEAARSRLEEAHNRLQELEAQLGQLEQPEEAPVEVPAQWQFERRSSRSRRPVEDAG